MAPVAPNPFQASHVVCGTLVWNENNTGSCSTQILDSKKAAVERDLEGAVRSPPALKGQSHVGICTVGEPTRSLVRAAGFWKLPWPLHISTSMGVFGVSFSLPPETWRSRAEPLVGEQCRTSSPPNKTIPRFLRCLLESCPVP